MIAIIFEVWPRGDGKQDYLETAAALRKHLEAIDGFVSIERFQSLTDSDKILSLSFFRDEAAVMAWRNTPEHRAAQWHGRARILTNYRLRVADVTRDYGMLDREQAPADSRDVHG
jgi:heme-degrading monooxygenase HmoA